MEKFLKSVFWLTLTGGILLWLAQPPVGWSPLAWLAPVPWLLLAQRPSSLTRREWRGVWFAAGLYWLAALHWIRLPHPLTVVGWPLLAGVMGAYFVLFLGLTRTAIHRFGVPMWLAAPVVWVGVEWVQLHFLSGFLMAGLSHSQAFSPRVIQLAAVCGAYGVSLVMTLTAAVGVELAGTKRLRIAPLFGAAGALAVMIALGWSLPPTSQETIGPKVALIQSNKLALWTSDPERDRKIMDRMIALTDEAKNQKPEVIIWPESMFRTMLMTFKGSTAPPAGIDAQVAESSTYAAKDLAYLSERFGRAPLLVGLDRCDLLASPSDYRVYNSAVLVNSEGQIAARYDKNHLVPFGEYIPIIKSLPNVSWLPPFTGAMKPGSEPAVMRVGAYRLSPNICYETVIPHVIRRQVATLSERGETPDLLVNITNDAWFWGSSELDMHLACAVLRAVETRTPLVIAANGGLSAVIDGSGRVRAVSERQREQVLIEPVPLDPRDSLYVRYGDWLAITCALATLVLATAQLFCLRFSAKSQAKV